MQKPRNGISGGDDMYSDGRPFKGVHVCLAITDWHVRPCGAQQEKIISVHREKIIYVQQATEATWLRRLGNLLCM
jgi:hypothetical protein